MAASTQPSMLDLRSTQMSTAESQASSIVSYIVVVLGACVSLPLIAYASYIIYSQSRRRGYLDLDKAMTYVKTASPQDSESHDCTHFYHELQSSTEFEPSSPEEEREEEEDEDDDEADREPPTFYIGVDSVEEMNSARFVQRAYLPKVRLPRRLCHEKMRRPLLLSL